MDDAGVQFGSVSHGRSLKTSVSHLPKGPGGLSGTTSASRSTYAAWRRLVSSTTPSRLARRPSIDSCDPCAIRTFLTLLSPMN